MKKKNGFLAVSIIFSFFVVFLMILTINLTAYAQNRILLNQVKKDIKTNISLEIKNKKCIRARKLHTEKCYSQNNYGCLATGYSEGDTIIYGNLGSGQTLNPGDAFDCDVNGDGIFDDETERFYYITDLTSNSNYAVLLYYNNTGTVAYNSAGVNNQGPVTVKNNLPTTTQWSNVSLSSITRNITDEDGAVKKSGFSYFGRAARLLTYQEVKSACTNALDTYGSLDKCDYLLENTYYQNSSLVYGYWLESVYGTYSAWDVYGVGRYVKNDSVSNSSFYGIRPAIEVLKTDMLLNEISIENTTDESFGLMKDCTNVGEVKDGYMCKFTNFYTNCYSRKVPFGTGNSWRKISINPKNMSILVHENISIMNEGDTISSSYFWIAESDYKRVKDLGVQGAEVTSGYKSGWTISFDNCEAKWQTNN